MTAHRPVMVAEMIAGLAPRDGGIYVDGTFGAGGYSEAILNAADCIVHAFDRDPQVAPHARRLKEKFGDMFHWYQECYGDMDTVLQNRGIGAVDGVALDIGVSSMQIDDSERGFSFSKDGPLDMRMSGQGMTASDFVNESDESELRSVIREFGEERHAKRIARAIVERRAEKPFARTGELAGLIDKILPTNRSRKIHGATKTFQAIRIYINNELDELRRGLLAAERLLKPAGRLVVVVFHSLEDRIVKTFLAERAEPKRKPSRHVPVDPTEQVENLTFRYLGKRGQTPSAEEISENPRARSARMRIAERTDRPILTALAT